MRRVYHGGPKGSFVPLPYAWRIEVAHGRLLRSRRLARSFENTLGSATSWLQVAYLVAVLEALTAPPRTPAQPKRRTAGRTHRRSVAVQAATAAATPYPG